MNHLLLKEQFAHSLRDRLDQTRHPRHPAAHRVAADELAADYPAHVAAAWLGHSTAIASKHHWQVTDADFERAVKAPESAAQNPAQYAREMG